MKKQDENICPHGALCAGQERKNIDKTYKQNKSSMDENNTREVTESEGDKTSSRLVREGLTEKVSVYCKA